MEDNEMTTIKISKNTRNRLADLCHKDESFEMFIVKLINEHEDRRIEQMINEKSGWFSWQNWNADAAEIWSFCRHQTQSIMGNMSAEAVVDSIHGAKTQIELAGENPQNTRVLLRRLSYVHFVAGYVRIWPPSKHLNHIIHYHWTKAEKMIQET